MGLGLLYNRRSRSLECIEQDCNIEISAAGYCPRRHSAIAPTIVLPEIEF